MRGLAAAVWLGTASVLAAHPELFVKFLEMATGARRAGQLSLVDYARLAL